MSAIGQRYGINMQKDQLEGLQKVYGQYLENIIPVGEQQLTGDEAAKIRAFKDVSCIAGQCSLGCCRGYGEGHTQVSSLLVKRECFTSTSGSCSSALSYSWCSLC